MTTPRTTLIVTLEASDMDALQDMIVAIARHMNDPDRIAAVRVDDSAVPVRAEVDLRPRPVDPRRLH